MAENESTLLGADKASNSMILVVANDPKFLKFLETALKLEFECEVLAVTRGRSAVMTAERIRPDLVIIDHHLLDLDALELSQRLHDIEELESVPTVLLNSPFTSCKKPHRYSTIFLSSPFTLGDLYTAVNRSLSGHVGG